MATQELARWLVTNPRVFASNVVTITDVDGASVRVFAGDVVGAIATMRKLGANLDPALVRQHMSATTSAILVVTADAQISIARFPWAEVLAESKALAR